MASKEQERANAIRAEGNAFYKTGNLDRAIVAYQQALALVHDDAVILGNLSAVQYESGDYNSCIENAEKALTLFSGLEDLDSAKLEKLERRILKAKIFRNHSEPVEQKNRRLSLIKNVPRYRPGMYDDVEYFSHGQDEPSSLFDAKIPKFAVSEKSVSMLFAGIGDARNLLRTLIGVAEHDRQFTPAKKRYHFTIIDINKCTITRDIIVLMLLDELASQEEDSDEAVDTLNTIFYVYMAQIMPRCAFKRLHETISRALTALESGKQPVSLVHCQIDDMLKYIDVLKQWQNEALKVFKVVKTIKKVTGKLEGYTHMMPGLEIPLPSGCEKEKQLYFATAMLTPPDRIMQVHDPKLATMLTRFLVGLEGQHADEFKKYAKEHWEVNTTIVDVDWHNSLLDEELYDFAHNPFHTCQYFQDETLPSQPRRPTRLYDHFAPFFQDVANAIKHLQGRVKIEAVLGDYIDFAEKLRFGLHHTTSKETNETPFALEYSRPKDFPDLYDRIHLSNIPDYTGGHLSTFLYATPILKSFKSSNVRANCLRNSDNWSNVETFFAEYQLITNRITLKQLTQVEVVRGGGSFLPLASYTIYRNSLQKRAFGDLLPRAEFSKWFYGLFFRLALPVRQNVQDMGRIIFSPLSLTILFRQLEHLRILGYPSHWMSECLSAIIENTVVTTCRPPRSSPSTIAEVEKIHPMKGISTAPFKDEMATFARIFEHILPFSLQSDAVPPEDDIYLYSFSLAKHKRNQENSKASVFLSLVFWDLKLVTNAGPMAHRCLEENLQALLEPSWTTNDAGVRNGSQKEALREHGLVVWSTITWNSHKKEASAWMPKKLVEHMVEQDFRCGLYRTDTWQPIAPTTSADGLGDIVKQGKRWSEVALASHPPMDAQKGMAT